MPRTRTKSGAGNITVYKRLDPDSLYYRYPEGSTTFFFVPKSDNLYLQPYPTSHEDMLADDDDLFEDVYADFLRTTPLNSRVRRELASRGQALAKGRAILGRIALDGMMPLIAFWENTTPIVTPENVQAFLKALYKKLPPFKEYKDNTVLLMPGHEPVTVTTFLGGRVSPQRAIKLKPLAAPPAADRDEKKYEIGGNSYSLADLQALRAASHTNGYTRPGLPHWRSVLCHDDIFKYPELDAYRPNACGKGDRPLRPTHPAMWRRAGLDAGIWPPPYDYGESFKAFFGLHDLFLS